MESYQSIGIVIGIIGIVLGLLGSFAYGWLAWVAIVSIVGIILVLVNTKHHEGVGIILIVLGILGNLLLIIPGIMAYRYKPQDKKETNTEVIQDEEPIDYGYARYIGGHTLYPKSEDIGVYFYNNRFSIWFNKRKSWLRIPLSNIVHMENSYEKKHTYTKIQFKENSGEQYVVIDFGKGMEIAQNLLHKKVWHPPEISSQNSTSVSSQVATAGVKCSNCGNVTGTLNSFCPKCGLKLTKLEVAKTATVSTIKCSNCGNETDTVNSFCPKCGFSLTRQTKLEQNKSRDLTGGLQDASNIAYGVSYVTDVQNNSEGVSDDEDDYDDDDN